jgi:hypothetical protein
MTCTTASASAVATTTVTNVFALLGCRCLASMTASRTRVIKICTLSTSVLLPAVLTLLTVFAGPAIAQTINSTTRTVTTTNFSVTWSTSSDTEAITNINWLGGQNLTNNQGIGTCFPAAPGSVEYFGNSYAPPDPWAGGLVLVGGGTTTPAGTTAWSGQVLSSGTAQVTINSASTGCPPSSAGINVQTTYSFSNPEDSSTNYFGVQRAFDFSTTTFAHDFRPYMARLSLSEGYTEVLYPDTSGALVTFNVYDCTYGCTGPVVIPDAILLSPAWDATQGWFAMHNPETLQGVVVARRPSTDPQGNPIVAQLWVDNDADGITDTNVSSFLLMSPTGGFTGGPVTEVETLCFYDSSIWTPSLTPPAPCTASGSTPTVLTSSLNPSTYGQPVTFTATVTGSGSVAPTGTVVFSWSGNVIGTATLNGSGVATLTKSDLNADSFPLVATYKGDANNLGSTSAVVNQVVEQTTSSATLTSSPNPSAVGESVTFTATITSPTVKPRGPVTFTTGTTVLGTAELINWNDEARITVSSLPAGSTTVTATYAGDSDIKGSSASVTQVVQ